jgi:hypothetical protein
MNTEKEWWVEEFSDSHFPMHEDGTFWYIDITGSEVENFRDQVIEDVANLLSKQKKKDWEEFREMVENTVEFTPSYLDVSREKMLEMIDAKLKEL